MLASSFLNAQPVESRLSVPLRTGSGGDTVAGVVALLSSFKCLLLILQILKRNKLVSWEVDRPEQ